MENIYPFTEYSCDIKIVRYSRAGEIREKLNRGESLTAAEKQFITEHVIDCSYSKTGIAVMGWIVSFADVLHRYIYCQCGHWVEVYACNKTCLRNAVYGRIDEIVELNNNKV